MDKKKKELTEDVEAVHSNMCNGGYLFNRFKTLDDIRIKENWFSFWNSDCNFPRRFGRTEELIEVFDNGWVKFEPLTENGSTLKIDDSLLRRARRGGGEEHSILKALAAQWLTSQGEKHVYFERTVYGARPDVYGEDLDCWIECGNTSPDKLMSSLFDSGCNSFILFPFVSHDMIEGYKFTVTIDSETRMNWLREKVMEYARELKI